MDDAVRRALEIEPTASPAERTIDITTTGARTGEPRRIEIWYHRVGGRYFITGTPDRPRAWYANLKAHPDFVVHLKHDLQADVPATARPIEDVAERRRVLGGILETASSLPGGLDTWVASSPLVEFVPTA